MIKDMNSNLIAKSLQPFELLKEKLEPGSLQSAQISPSNTTVAEPNDIMIQFMLANSLETTRSPSFRITIPETFEVVNSCSFEAFSANLNSAATCTIIGQQAIISNIAVATNAFIEGQVIFKITGTIKNPLTATDDVGKFILETLINSSEVVDSA